MDGQTDLNGLHRELGGKMVAFAGWDMPVQFPAGVMAEHNWTREKAGLFDVGHMGQVILRSASGRAEDAARALETLVPADIVGLGEGRQRYALFTDAAGGILDDLMVANRGDHLFVVVNAARTGHDIGHLRTLGGVEVKPVEARGLIALQGPRAEAALATLLPNVARMRFMDVATMAIPGGEVWISRSGYTGEDGFEISVPSREVEGFARALLEHPDVAPIGLGARDSLRLEAGLCLYGTDIDETTSPVEADLGWSIGKARRPGGARAGGFPGAERILTELEDGPARRRVGLSPEGRVPMRAGTRLYPDADGADAVGAVTSGTFGPTVGGPVSMGYVDARHATPGTILSGDVRGRRHPVRVTALPFVPARFKR